MEPMETQREEENLFESRYKKLLLEKTKKLKSKEIEYAQVHQALIHLQSSKIPDMENEIINLRTEKEVSQHNMARVMEQNMKLRERITKKDSEIFELTRKLQFSRKKINNLRMLKDKIRNDRKTLRRRLSLGVDFRKYCEEYESSPKKSAPPPKSPKSPGVNQRSNSLPSNGREYVQIHRVRIAEETTQELGILKQMNTDIREVYEAMIRMVKDNFCEVGNYIKMIQMKEKKRSIEIGEDELEPSIRNKVMYSPVKDLKKKVSFTGLRKRRRHRKKRASQSFGGENNASGYVGLFGEVLEELGVLSFHKNNNNHFQHKCGYLQVAKICLFWKKRYVVVSNIFNSISIYKDETKNHLETRVSLEGCRVVMGPKKKFTFKVQSSLFCLQFRVPSERKKRVKMWVSYINDLLKIRRVAPLKLNPTNQSNEDEIVLRVNIDEEEEEEEETVEETSQFEAIVD